MPYLGTNNCYVWSGHSADKTELNKNKLFAFESKIVGFIKNAMRPTSEKNHCFENKPS